MKTIILSMILCFSVYPWGFVGHRTIATIAWQQMDSTSKAYVNSILPPGTDFISVSTWADEIKQHRPQTKPWHYLDLPVREDISFTDVDKYRKSNRNDILSKTEQFIAELKSGTADKTRQAEALYFIIHFIGDLHMPLHCASDDDKGGNGKSLRFFKPGAKKNGRKVNLHSLWDHMIQAKATENPESLAVAIIQIYTPRHIPGAMSQPIRVDYSQTDPSIMLHGSYMFAKDIIYKDLPKGSYKTPYELPRDYYRANRHHVELLLYIAGWRLKTVLEVISGSARTKL